MESDTNISTLTINTENSVCSPLTCTEDDDQYKLECKECRRLVHYRCTNLPLYQIERFLTKGYSRYICINCVVVPEYLKRIVTNSTVTDPSHARTMTELTDALKLTTEENEDHMVQNTALLYKQTELKADLGKQIDEALHNKEEVTKLKSEITQYETLVKSHEQNEANLKMVIVTQKSELHKQEQMFHEVGNPDYDALTKLEALVNNKLEAVGRTLKESVLKEVNENNNKLNEKLDKVMNENRTYAESVKNIPSSEEILRFPNETPDLRVIIKEARNEQLAEETEKKQRSCNIIIHGVKESITTDREEAKERDREFVSNFITALGLSISHKICLRIGRPEPEKKRPIKVVFNSEGEKIQIMENLKELKGQESFRGISITDDYTLDERQMIKEYSEKAKENNKKEPEHSRYVWHVRGSPKNGLRLKKFLKRTPLTA